MTATDQKRKPARGEGAPGLIELRQRLDATELPGLEHRTPVEKMINGLPTLEEMRAQRKPDEVLAEMAQRSRDEGQYLRMAAKEFPTIRHKEPGAVERALEIFQKAREV